MDSAATLFMKCCTENDKIMNTILLFLGGAMSVETFRVLTFFRWSIIASKLPGRTDNEIKNHWHTHLKKRSKQNLRKAEVKDLLLGEASHCEKSQNTDHSESESVPGDYAPSHHILESSVLSQETACSSDFTSSSSPHDQLSSGVNWAVDQDSLGMSETFDQFSGDFWTEPFVADNTFVPNYRLSPLFDADFISPYDSYDLGF